MTLVSIDGEIRSAFAQMRVRTPLMEEAYRLFDDLRYVKRDCSGSARLWGGIFGPPLTGKTMSVTTYIETKIVDELIQHGKFASDMSREAIARQQRIVVPVIASPQATPRSLMMDILQALGEPASLRGTSVQELLARVCECLRDRGTELLIIEEAQHLFDERSWSHLTSQTGTVVTKTLKTLLLKGTAPVVLIGNMEARSCLMSNVELAARCVGELKFSALDIADDIQRSIFVEFVGTLGIKLKQHGLFEEPSDFLSGGVVAGIHEVANGCLGMASAIICSASIVARKAGAARVTREHLAIATDVWAVPIGMIDHNPFEDDIPGTVCGRNTRSLGTIRRKRLT